MKTNVLDINGKKTKEITLPSCFSEKIREDIVSKVLEASKTRQPYAPSPIGGKQHAASGKIHHLRHVWKNSYGRGMSRIPRKIMSRRGSQFNWVGAEVPNTVGGRRAHPPKTIAMINTKKVNKKEMIIALKSVLTATTNGKIITERYERLSDKKISAPFVVEAKIVSLKTKELLSSLKNIFGEAFEVVVKKRKVRSGIGKMRGRRHKKNAGLLLVTGNEEKIKTNVIDVRKVKELNVTDLAKGGIGRLTMYTEKAVNELGERLK